MNEQYRKVLNTRKSSDYIITSLIDNFLSSHYPCNDISAYVDLLAGYAFKSSWFSDQGMPLLRNINVKPQRIDWNERVFLKNELIGSFKRFQLEEGDIVFSMDGSVSNEGVKIAIVRKEDLPCYLLQRVCRLKTESRLKREYLFWLLQTDRFIEYVAGSNRSIAISHISSEQILKYRIPIPPLSIQEEIVDFLNNKERKLSDSRLGEKLSKVLKFYHENTQFSFQLEKSINYVEKLRQAILQEAVTGKLVPQDPNDEPASNLLEKIKTEKEKQVREMKIKKEYLPLPIKEEEIPFNLPNGWEWVRLGEVASLITKGSSPRWQGINYVEKEKGILFITSENVGSYRIDLSNGKYVEKKFNEIEPRSILKKGDFLMNIVGASIGRTALFDLDQEDVNINQAVCLIRLCGDFLIKDYLLHFFNSYFCIKNMYDKQVEMARPNLSMGNIARFLVPIPPFAEQKRIAQKVEQLMELCNEVEKKVKENQKNSGFLLEAVLKEAFAS
jgi:type I restriction enzyme S subunit